MNPIRRSGARAMAFDPFSGPLPRRIAIPLTLVSGLLALTGCTLLVAYGVAPESVEGAAGEMLASGGSLSDRARDRLPELIHVAAASCVLWGLLGLAWLRQPSRLQRLVMEDVLGSSPRRVLTLSAAIGVAMLVLYDVNRRVDVEWLATLFRKEGVLEQLTALLYLLASVGLAVAAVRLRAHARSSDGVSPWIAPRAVTWLSICLGVQAVGFFVVAGEEVSWGQHLLGYETPAAVVEVNTQGEANVHNLLTKERLDSGTRLAAVTAFAMLLGGWIVLAAGTGRALRILVPHPALMPLAFLTFLIAPWTHLEILEVMSAFFVAFYTWRLLRARLGTGDDTAAMTGPGAEVAVPGDPLQRSVAASAAGRPPRRAGSETRRTERTRTR